MIKKDLMHSFGCVCEGLSRQEELSGYTAVFGVPERIRREKKNPVEYQDVPFLIPLFLRCEKYFSL